MNRRRRGAIGLAIAATLTIAWFTLRPDTDGLPPVTDNGYLLTDIVLNVLLFVPLGIGLALAGVRRRRVLTIGTLFSMGIEVSQRYWIFGRTASIHDVVTNALGAVLGATLVLAWSERARWRRILGIPIAATVVAIWTIGAMLVVPSLPAGTPRWFGFWAHEFAGTTLFPGKILTLAVQGMPLPDGPIPETDALRQRMVESDTIRLTTELISAGPVEGRAQLVGVGSGEGEELLSLWQTGTSILARQRLRLSDFSVRTFWLRMDHAMPVSPGDTIRLVFEATRRTVRLRLDQGGSSQATRVRLSPELFWTGFLPFEYEAGSFPWWPLSGVAVIFLVLGFFLAPNRGAAIAALALTLLIGPLIGRTALPSLGTIVTGLAGLLAGWWLAGKTG